MYILNLQWIAGFLILKIGQNSVECGLQFICAIRAGANLGVLAFKSGLICQKLVVICSTRAGAILGVLACKSAFYVKK